LARTLLDHIAKPGQKARGLAIALEDHQRLRKALSMVPSIKFQRYELSFQLLMTLNFGSSLFDLLTCPQDAVGVDAAVTVPFCCQTSVILDKKIRPHLGPFPGVSAST